MVISSVNRDNFIYSFIILSIFFLFKFLFLALLHLLELPVLCKSGWKLPKFGEKQKPVDQRSTRLVRADFFALFLIFSDQTEKHNRETLCLIFSQFSSVAQSCLTLCDPMNCSMPGLPVHHQLPEFTQTHVHRVGDAIQPSHPLSSPSPPASNPSQHQSLFQWVSSLHEVAKVLEFQL